MWNLNIYQYLERIIRYSTRVVLGTPFLSKYGIVLAVFVLCTLFAGMLCMSFLLTMYGWFGISFSYVKMNSDTTVDDIRATLTAKYADEPFVSVLKKGQVPHTRYVRGSNFCNIAVFEDHIKGRAIIISVIDNLVKGASGQAIQNMNLIMGFDETTALMQQPMFP